MRWVCLLRGVNVGGNHKMKMTELCELFSTSLGYPGARTFIQSGNVVFSSDRKPNSATLEKAIEARFGFHSDVILRSAAELRSAIAANPFAQRDGLDPSKLTVTFLSKDPPAESAQKLAAFDAAGEEIALLGRELSIYFHQGLGKTKLKFPALARILGEPGTTRNWNTVLKLDELASADG